MPVRRSFVALLALASAMACQSSLSPRSNLDGMWEWEFNRNPSGSSITLSLATAGPTVTGTGTICGVGPACSPGSVTITGEHTVNAFRLTIRDQLAFMATYSGQVLSNKELRGTWLQGSDSGTVVFYRN
ncbi:MAG: hypothetical protein DMD59_04680 [Gemmatimonadetes bacterium]|nr:MAG: hypothetical protein DMD59_04680 [Gemmatimonadota bacterium]